MRSLKLITILLFLTVGSLPAQLIQLDSLARELTQNTTRDTNRVLTLLELCEKIYPYEPDSARRMAEEARDICEEKEAWKLLSYTHYDLALCDITLSEYDRSIALFRKSREGFEKYGVKQKTANTYCMEGAVYIYKGEFGPALELLVDCHGRMVELDNKVGIMASLGNIAYIYDETGENVKAGEIYGEMVVQSREINDSSYLALALNNYSSSLISMDSLDKAKLLLEEAILIYDNSDARSGIVDAHNNMGNIYQQRGNYVQARVYYEKALEYGKEMHDDFVTSRAYAHMGGLSQELGEYFQAKEEFDSALVLTRKSGAQDDELQVLEQLVALSEETGDLAAGFVYLKDFIELRDTLYSDEKQAQISSIQEAFNSERKENENILLRERIQRKDQFLWAVGIGLTLMLFFFILLFLSYNRFRKANRLLALQKLEIERQKDQLAEKNRALSELDQEKDNLMNIVAHDLKAPLSKVKGLVQLLPDEGNINEEQGAILSLVEQVTQSGEDLIQDLLDVNHFEYNQARLEISRFDLVTFLDEEILAYQRIAKKKSIVINYDGPAEGQTIRTDRALLSRIMDNLVSNALKFSPVNSKVTIRLGAKNGQYHLQVSDQGPGFSEEDKTKMFRKFQKLSARPTGGENSTGLGLSIIKVLTEKLKGEVELSSEKDKGATFTIVLPQLYE